MSNDGVYGDDMTRRRLSDHEVELLLSGRASEEEDLARLAALLDAMKREHLRVPSEQTIASFASEAATIAGTAPSQSAPEANRSRISRILSSRRFVSTLAGFALVLGMTGVAAASDDAAPGNALYGVDRSLELIGIGSGGPAERVAEARVLLDGGKVSEAIAHAAEAVEESTSGKADSPESSRASEELRGAAESVAGAGDGAVSTEVRDSVAEMLTEMSDMIDSGESEGPAFGQRVAEIARDIGGGDEDTEDTEPGEDEGGDEQGPPDDEPGGPPQETPGPPGSTAPGSTPPGSTPPGTTPPSTTPPSTTPPSTTPPSTTPPGDGPQAAVP